MKKEQSYGCWCPVQKNTPILKAILLLDIIAIIFTVYLALSHDGDIMYAMPTLALVMASMLIIWDRYRG